MLSDLERGKGKLDIKMTYMDAFEVGENIAVTPGKVIWQTDLMQLIQYEPTTKDVYKRPLLIVPPWINKFYILDLRPKNSFVKWATDQGYTVFMISWVNPDETLAAKTFDDYMLDGPLAALEALRHGRFAAVAIMDEQASLQAQAPVPAVVGAPGDEVGRSVETVSHQHRPDAVRQPPGDDLQQPALLGKPDRPRGFPDAPSQR